MAWLLIATIGFLKLQTHTQTTKVANSKAFTCKLCDNNTHSKGLITWAGEAMRMNSVLPAVLLLNNKNRSDEKCS